MDSTQIEQFKEKLDDQHEWPGSYIFKFIVPSDKVQQVEALLGDGTELKESKNGNYISVTARLHLNSSQEVVDIYIKAKSIDGIISL